MSEPQPIILASGSPRRQELLSRLELPFTVEVSDEPEELDAGLPPERQAMALAERKAVTVARQRRHGLIIGGDTLLSFYGEPIGKPVDDADAERILKRLSGRSHEVWTGLAVIDAATGRIEKTSVPSVVRFHPLSDDEITAYIATGEGRDKAGAYAIQGLGASLIAAIHGCYNNIVGLPLCELAELLRRFGIEVSAEPLVCSRPDGSLCPRLARMAT